MKKFFIFCLMAFVMCVNVNAQNDYGIWASYEVKKDELKGSEEYTSYHFYEVDPNDWGIVKCFIFTSDGNMWIKLSEYELFSKSLYAEQSIFFTDILFGIYDDNNSLIDMFTIQCAVTDDLNVAMILSNSNEKKTKIFNVINGNGYIRMVNKDIDFTINNLSTPFGEEILKTVTNSKKVTIKNEFLKDFGIKHDIVFNVN